jgi:YbbR domain-containing protein
VKNLTLKIVCALVAILVWIQVASTALVEADVSLPLQVVGLDGRWTLAGSGLPDQANVRLRAPKLSLLANDYFGVPLGSVQMDVSGYEPGPVTLFVLKDSDVRTEANVVSLLPPVRLALHVDWREQQRLPVRVPLQGQLPGDRMLAGPVVAVPDSLDVSGPRRFFKDLATLTTEPVNLSDVNTTLVRDLALAGVPGELKLAAASVRVTVPVTRLDERVVANVPVLAETSGQLFEAGVSPPVCDVLVRGPADSVAAMTSAELRVTVPVDNLGVGVHQVIGQVQHPDWVIAVRLDPETFMVILEVAEPVAEERR